MQLGMIGLGRMGASMVVRLEKAGHNCVVYDMSAKAVEASVKQGATGAGVAGGVCAEAPEAARSVADGAGGRGGRDAGQAGAAAGEGRHRDRWRQLVLPRRYSPGKRVEGERDALCGRGHQRRRVGRGPRVLPDDRRRRWRSAASGPDLRELWRRGSPACRARRGGRRCPAHRSRAICTAGRAARGTS